MPKDKSGKKMTMKEDLPKPPIYAWCNNTGAPSHVYMLKQPNGKLAVYSSVDVKLWALNLKPEDAAQFIMDKWGGVLPSLLVQANHVATNKFTQAYPGVHLTYEDAKERVVKMRLLQRIDKLDLRQIRALTRALHPKNVERIMEEREHRKSNHRPIKAGPLEVAPKKKKKAAEDIAVPVPSYVLDAEPFTFKKKKKKRA